MKVPWKRKEKWVSLSSGFEIPVPILSDAAIASQSVSDGRLIPLLVLDCSKRPDLTDLIDAHQNSLPGDVLSTWGRISTYPEGNLALFLSFKRPVELDVSINFDILTQAILIELILKSKCLYLQYGKIGEKALDILTENRMIAEIGAHLPDVRWVELWSNAIVSNLRSEGHSKSTSKKMASVIIDYMRSDAGIWKRSPQI